MDRRSGFLMESLMKSLILVQMNPTRWIFAVRFLLGLVALRCSCCARSCAEQWCCFSCSRATQQKSGAQNQDLNAKIISNDTKLALF